MELPRTTRVGELRDLPGFISLVDFCPVVPERLSSLDLDLLCLLLLRLFRQLLLHLVFARQILVGDISALVKALQERGVQRGATVQLHTHTNGLKER